MSKVDFEQLKQISAEVRAIQDRSKQNGQHLNMEDQQILDQLAAKREDLLDDIIFHGYGS